LPSVFILFRLQNVLYLRLPEITPVRRTEKE
jgi:hypothetical protein